MNTQYVVVVEVDNKRAAAAYQKGLADLEVIWPQLMEYAGHVDEKRRAAYDKGQEKARKEQEAIEARLKAHEKAIKEWEQKKFCAGPRPAYQWAPYYDLGSFELPPRYLRDLYTSIRLELQNMANLAGAAISPYKMTEGQVYRMIEWEDGSRIDSLKNGMAKDI